MALTVAGSPSSRTGQIRLTDGARILLRKPGSGRANSRAVEIPLQARCSETNPLVALAFASFAQTSMSNASLLKFQLQRNNSSWPVELSMERHVAYYL